MFSNSTIDIPVKPRVLIADDSRIVRATLIKHIQGMFEFREALDGEEAWQTLLIDPNIRVVITDLTMPKLDGYGLLGRIRSSEIARIRNLPVVVISGSDEEEERERAKAAGATDLITKGIGTAQLLSRLDILSKLVSGKSDFERSLENLVVNTPNTPRLTLAIPTELHAHAEKMLITVVQSGKDFIVLNVCLGLVHTSLEGNAALPPVSAVEAVGQLLQRTIRQTDCVAKTGEAEFTLVSSSMNFDSARNFAYRICRAISHAHLINDNQISLIASCGVTSLSEKAVDGSTASPDFNIMRDKAHQRAHLGLRHMVNGIVGWDEELALRSADGTAQHAMPDATHNGAHSTTNVNGSGAVLSGAVSEDSKPAVDLATMLQWIKEGKQDQVRQHMGELSGELQSLVDLMLPHNKR